MRKHKVVISNNIANQPSEHELMVALLLTKLLSTDIEFVRTESHRTPDFIINGELWELKSPKGNSKKTIENNLRSARGQSSNIILDLTRSPMNTTQAVARTRYFLSNTRGCPKIKKLFIIDKTKKIIDIR